MRGLNLYQRNDPREQQSFLRPTLSGVKYSELDNYESYLRRGVSLHPDTRDSWNRQRYLNQPYSHQIGNWFAQSVLGEIIGGGISAVGATLELPISIIESIRGEDSDFKNFITEFGDSITQYSKDKFPIYRRNPGKAWDVGDLGWWMEHGVSVASTVGLMLPAFAATKGITTLGKAARLIDKYNKGRLVSKGALGGAELEMAIGAIHTPVFMRNAENFKESLQVVNDIFNISMGDFSKMDDVEFDNWRRTDGLDITKGEKISRREAAKRIASESGWRTYKVDASNVVFDFVQTLPLVRGFKPMIGPARQANKAVKVAQKASLGEGVSSKYFKELTSQAISRFGLFGYEPVTEGIEEMVNAIAQHEGMYLGKNIIKDSENTHFQQRLSEYLNDPANWEQAFWGFMGGLSFGATARAVNKIPGFAGVTIKDIASRQTDEITGRSAITANIVAANKKIDEGYNPFSLRQEGLEDVYDKIEGTPEQIEELKDKYRNRLWRDYAYNLVASSSRTGTTHLMKEMINSPNFLSQIEEQFGIDNATAIENIAKLNNYIDTFQSSFNRHTRAIHKKNYPGWIKQSLAIDNARKEMNIDAIKKDLVNVESIIAELKANDPEYKNILENLPDNVSIEDVENAIKKEAFDRMVNALDYHANKTKNPSRRHEAEMKRDRFIANNQELKNIKSKVDVSKLSDKIFDEYASKLFKESLINNEEESLRNEETRVKNTVETFEDTAKNKEDDFTKEYDRLSDAAIDKAKTVEEVDKAEKDMLEALDKDSVFQNKGEDLKIKNRIRDKIKKKFETARRGRRIDEIKDNDDIVEEKPEDAKTLADDYSERIKELIEEGEELSPESKSLFESLRELYDKTKAENTDASIIDYIGNTLNERIKDVEQNSILRDQIRKDILENEDTSSEEYIKKLKESSKQSANSETKTGKLFNKVINELLVEAGVNDAVREMMDSEDAELKDIIDDAAKESDETSEAGPLTEEEEQFKKESKVAFRLLNYVTRVLHYDLSRPLHFEQLLEHIYYGTRLGESYLDLAARSLPSIFVWLKKNGYLHKDSVIDIEKSTEDTVRDVKSRVDEFGNPEYETIENTGGPRSINTYISLFQDDYGISINRDRTVNGDIMTREKAEALRIIFEVLRKGHKLDFRVDVNHPDYEKGMSNESVPIVAYYKGKNLGIYINDIPYLETENSIINKLLDNPIALKRLQAAYGVIQRFVNGENSVEEFKKLSDNKTRYSQFLYELLGIDPNSKNAKDKLEEGIHHLARVIMFGQRLTYQYPKFNKDKIEKNLRTWSAKIRRDLENNYRIRSYINGDINKVFNTEITHISQGTLVVSREKKDNKVGGHINRKLTEVIDDIENIHLADVKSNTGKTDLISLTHELLPADMRRDKAYRFAGFGYVILRGAGGKFIPVPLHRSFVNKVGDYLSGSSSSYATKLNRKVKDLTDAILNRILYLKQNDTSKILGDETLLSLRKQLNEIIYIQDTTDNTGKNKIKLTHFQIHNNGVKFISDGKEYAIELTETNKSFTIRIDGENTVNNYSNPEDFANILYKALGGLRLNVINSKLKDKTKYTDPADPNVEHESYKHFVIDRGFMYTTIGKLVDERGNKISNFTGRPEDNNKGFMTGSPLIINVDANTGVKKLHEHVPVELSEEYIPDPRYSFMYQIADEEGILFKVDDSPVNNKKYAQVDHKDNTVTLNKNWIDLKSDLSKELIVIHEIIHVPLRRIMGDKNSEQYKKLAKFRSSLIKSSKTTAKKIAKEHNLDYKKYINYLNKAKGNLSEIVTYALSDTDIATFLNLLESRSETRESDSMWNKLKRIIIEIIGTVINTKSKLQELVTILDDIAGIETTEATSDPTTKIETEDKNIIDDTLDDRFPTDLIDEAEELSNKEPAKSNQLSLFDDYTAPVTFDYIPGSSPTTRNFSFAEVDNWVDTINWLFHRHEMTKSFTREQVYRDPRRDIKNRIIANIRNSIAKFIQTEFNKQDNTAAEVALKEKVIDAIGVKQIQVGVYERSSLRPSILEDIQKLVKGVKGTRLANTIKGVLDLQQEDSQLWKIAKDEFNRKGIVITDENEIQEKNESATARWRHGAQFKVRVKDTVKTRIKHFFYIKPILDKEISYWDEKTGTLVSENKSTPTIFPNRLNGKHLNTLANVLAGASSIQEMLDRIYDYAKATDPSMFQIWNDLSNDHMLAKGFYSSFNRSFPNRVIELFRVFPRKKGTSIGMVADIENQTNDPVYRAADEWRSTIENRVQSNYYTEDKLSDFRKQYRLIEKLTARVALDPINLAAAIHKLYYDIGVYIDESVILREIENDANYEEYEARATIDLEQKAKEGQDAVETYIKGEIVRDKFTQRISNIINHIKDLNEDKSMPFDQNRLVDLARIQAKYVPSSDIVYLNVEGNQVAGLLQPNSLLTFRDKLKSKHSDSINAVAEEFLNFSQAPGMNYSNLLWNTNPQDPNGFLNYNRTDAITVVNGFKKRIKIPTRSSDNRTSLVKNFIDRFDIQIHAGNKNINHIVGNLYSNIPHEDWLLTALLHHIQYDDGVNNRGLAKTKSNPNGIITPSIVLADREYSYLFKLVKIALESSKFSQENRFKIDRSSPLWGAIYNTVLQEIERIDANVDMIFKLDENNNLVPKTEDDEGYVKPQLYKHYTLDKQGNKVFVDKNGMPVGRVFKFHNIKIDKAGKRTTTNDISIVRKGKVINILEATIYKGLPSTIFIEPGEQLANHIDDFINTLVSEAIEKISPYADIINDKIGKDNFNRVVAEFILNNYINNIEQQNLFFGHPYEFETDTDASKRAGTAVSSGNRITNISIGEGENQLGRSTFSGVTVNDIYDEVLTLDFIADVLAKDIRKRKAISSKTKYDINNLRRHHRGTLPISELNDLEKLLYRALKPYMSVSTTDGQSYITLDEFEYRIQGIGLYDKYKPLIDLIRKGKELSYNQLVEFIQVQKNVYYRRAFDPTLGDIRTSVIKNSELVLIPQLYNNNEALKAINDAMVKSNTHQLNFLSAEKVGAKDIITLLDDTGKIKGNLAEEFSRAQNTYHYENLFRQQEVNDHLKDTTNKAGVQIMKMFLNYINTKSTDKQYDINGTKVTGQELLDQFFDIYTYNIRESEYNLLKEFAEEKDGEFVLDDNDNYVVSIEKIIDKIRAEATRNGTSDNTKMALFFDEDIDNSVVPLSFNGFRKHWVSFATSFHTNNVTNQKLPGGHVSLTSNALNESLMGDKTKASELTQSALGITGRRLRGMRKGENGEILPAEILLPAWSKRFFDTAGNRIKIEDIPAELRRMVLYRIPTEDQHSMMYVEVVGFYPEELGSTIVLPDEIVPQTGTDFDLDTAFLIYKHFRRNIQGKFEVVPYMDENTSIEARAQEFGMERAKKDYESDEFYEYLQEHLPKATYRNANKEQVEITEDELEEINSYIFNPDGTLNTDFISEVNRARYKDDTKGDATISDIIWEDLIDKKEENSISINDLEYKFNAIAALKGVLTKYNVHIKQQTIDNWTKQLEGKPIEEQNSRRARENRIIDIMISVISNPEHLAKVFTTSGYPNILEAKEDIEQNELTPNNATFFGQMEYRIRNVDGIHLKARSVDLDGFLSIVSSVGMTVADTHTLQIQYSKDYSTARLRAKFGKDNVTDDNIVTHKMIGNNFANDFLNVDDEYFLSYASETTALILDISKVTLPRNINRYTFPIWKLFTSFGSNYNVATRFINQPILVDLVKNQAVLSRQSLTGFGSDPIERTRRQWMAKLYTASRFKNGNLDEQVKKHGMIFTNANNEDMVFKGLRYHPSDKPVLNPEQLKKNLTPRNKEEFYRDQLLVLNLFKNLKETSDQIDDMNTALSVDSSRVGPTYNHTYNILQKIDDLGNGTKDQAPLLFIKGEPAIKHFYPVRFKDFNADPIYPSFQAYLIHSNLSSIISFGQLFIEEKTPYREFIATVTDKRYNERISDLAISYLNNYMTDTLPFYIDSNISQAKINESTIDNPLSDSAKHPVIKERRRIIGVETEYNSTLDITNPKNFTEFRQLSLANKINLIFNNPTYREMLNIGKDGSSLFDYLETKSTPSIKARFGREFVYYTQNEREDSMVDRFRELWAVDNMFIKDTLLDIIKYIHINNGFGFTFTGMSKLIPTELIIRDYDKVGSPNGFGLAAKMHRAFEESETALDTATLAELELAFRRANWKNDYLVPVMYPNNYSKSSAKSNWKQDEVGVIFVTKKQLALEKPSVQNAKIIKIPISSVTPVSLDNDLFDKVVSGEKTQITTITDDIYRPGQIINIKSKKGRYAKVKIDAVFMGETAVNTHIENITDGKHNDLEKFLEDTKDEARANWIKKEGYSNGTKFLGDLRRADVFNNKPSIVVLQFREVNDGNTKKSKFITRDEYMLFQKQELEFKEEVAYFPVSKLEPFEYTEFSIIPSNNVKSRTDLMIRYITDMDEASLYDNIPEDVSYAELKPGTEPRDVRMVESSVTYLGDFVNRMTQRAVVHDNKTINQVNEKLKNEIIDDLDQLNLHQVYEGLSIAYDYNSDTARWIDARLSKWEKMDMSEIIKGKVEVKDGDTGKVKTMKRSRKFTEDLRYMKSFVKALRKVSVLEVGGTSLSPIEYKINKVVKQLRELGHTIEDIDQRINRIGKKYHHEAIEPYTSNPNIKDEILDLFTSTNDENFFQMYLDPLADTHNPFVANFIRRYNVTYYNAEREVDTYFQKIYKGFKKHFGRESNIDIRHLMEKIGGVDSGRFISKYGSAYKDVLYDFNQRIKDAIAKHGEGSNEMFDAMRERDKWMLDNLQHKYINGYNEAKAELIAILDAVPEARKINWLLNKKRLEILSPYRGDSDVNYSLGDIRKLNDIAKLRQKYRSETEEDGVTLKTGKDLEIAKALDKYLDAARDFYKKYHDPNAKSEKWEKAKARNKARLTEEAYNEWLAYNTELKYEDEFWDMYINHLNNLRGASMAETANVQFQLNQYKTRGIINGRLIDKVPDLRRAIKLYEEGKVSDVGLRNIKFVPEEERTVVYKQKYHETLSREKDKYSKITDDFIAEMGSILNKYLMDIRPAKADPIISEADMQRLMELEKEISLVRNPFNADGTYKEDWLDLVNDRYGSWFIKNHDIHIDEKAFKEASEEAKSKGKEYYRAWEAFNTEIAFDQKVLDMYHEHLEQLARLAKKSKKDKVPGSSKLLRLYLRHFEDRNKDVDFESLTDQQQAKILDLLTKGFHYNGKIEHGKGDTDVLTLSDMNMTHYYISKGNKVYVRDGIKGVSERIKRRRKTAKANKNQNAIEEVIESMNLFMEDVPSQYYEAELLMRDIKFDYRKNTIDDLTGNEGKWFYDNHTLDHNGNIVPLDFWTKTEPKNKELITNKPKVRYWGTFKPKDQVQLEIGSVETSPIDKEKTASKKWIEDNVKYEKTTYYNEAMADYNRTMANGTNAQKKRARDWYEANHYFDPYTREMKPIFTWTKMQPLDSKYINENNPISIWRDSRPHEDYINEKVETDDRGTPMPNKISSQWSSLTNKEREQLAFIKDVIVDLTQMLDKRSMVDDGWIPALSIADKGGNILERAIKRAGYFGATNKSDYTDEHDDIIYFLDLPFISKINKHKPLNPPPYRKGETFEEYEERISKYAEKQGYEGLSSLEEIRTKQKELYEENLEHHTKSISYDLAQILPAFAKSAIRYKHKKDMEAEVYLALDEVARMDINRKNDRGNLYVNRVLDRKLGIKKVATEKGENTNLYNHFRTWMKQIFYDHFEADEKHTALFRVLQNYTSARGMWLNYTGAFNNVAYGKVQMAMESTAGYYYKKKHGRKAEKEYWGNAWSFFSDINKKSSSTITNGLIKYFGVLQLQDEKDFATVDKYRSEAWRHLMSTNSLFFLHHMGEHYMQNKALIAMLHSHRVIGGRVLSYEDYLREKKDDVLQKILSEEEYNEYLKYVEKEEAEVKDKVSKRTYRQKYIRQLDGVKKKAYIEETKNLEKQVSDEFEEFPTYYEAFSLEDGFIKENPDIKVNEDEYAKFKIKVVQVNHKIHGIYDRLHANSIQHKAVGRLAVQFRKWMRPAWTKRFGTRFWKSHWNEGRMEWDKGAYVSFAEFIGTPISDNLSKEARNAEEFGVFKAVGNIITDYMKFAVNLRTNWNSLDRFEKANVKRTLNDIISLIGVVIIGHLLMGLKGDDDKKYQWSWLNLAIYLQNRLELELRQFTPYGFINETKKLVKTPVAAQSSIEELIKLTYYGFNYINPLIDEEQKIYRGGPYHGEWKAGVYAQRSIPIWNQYFKSMHLGNYYKLF